MCLSSCLGSWKLEKSYVGCDMMALNSEKGVKLIPKEGCDLSLRICLCILKWYGIIYLCLRGL